MTTRFREPTPMSKTPVLIVEDEPDIADLIQFHLQREGFAPRVASSGSEALRCVEEARPALILLDIMLPDLDGLEVCRRLKRQEGVSEVPIIMVTARGEESDIVVGLELGADDYITKPFSPRVLIARVKTVLRRREPEVAPGGMLTLAGGQVSIDPERHEVRVHGRVIDLTLTQYKLLQHLALRPGFVRTRDQIVAAVRGEDAVLSSRVIDVHVAALRQKLGGLGDMVETVRGVGYRLSESGVTEAV
jgi:two-component system phosphate regulon response regulator PhoB